MNIDFLTMDGSPLNVTMRSLYGLDGTIGCGGSEYLMLTLCEEWTKAGHQVRLYNNPREYGVSPFEQLPLSAYNPNEPRDVLINFRSANPRAVATNNCFKCWLSTDQFSTGDYASFAHCVDKIVCISPRHAQFFADTYGIKNTTVIDIPVRMQDFDELGKVEKVRNRLIFTSVPARGLDNLLRIYPMIQREVPDVSLVITSDYRLWGVGPSNEHFRVKWMKHTGVSFFGALPRKQYLEELMKAQILLYPCNYDELFCVSVAEAQYAGAYPITSSTGALPTTNMGSVLDGNGDDPRMDRQFVTEVVTLLNDPKQLAEKQLSTSFKVTERFSPERILKIWNEMVFK